MNGTILILGEKTPTLDLTARYLRKNGFVALTCSSASSALERFRSAGGNIEILVADVSLSDCSGVEVAGRLMSQAPALKALFVCGCPSQRWGQYDSTLLGQLPPDSVRFLCKPYSGPELLARLAELSGTAPNIATSAEPCVAPTDTHEPEEGPSDYLDFVHDAVLVRSLDGRIHYWNQEAENLYGWSKDEATGHVAHELLHTVFPEPLETIVTTVRTHRCWEGDLHQTVRNGNPVIVSSRWIVRMTGKSQVEILELNRDITAQKRVEEGFRGLSMELQSRLVELHQAEQLFRSLLEGSHDSLLVVDGSGQIVLANARIEKQFGYTRQELLGQRVDMLLPERLRGHNLERRLENLKESRPAPEEQELFGLRKNGEEFPIEISLCPFEAGSALPTAGLILDIADRSRVGKGAKKKATPKTQTQKRG